MDYLLENRSSSSLIPQEILSFMNYNSDQYEEIQNQYSNLIIFNKPPIEQSIIRKPIINSWIRSKKNNIDPASPLVLKKLSDRQIDALLKDNKMLINSAMPLLKNLVSYFFMDNSFGLSLYDKNGITLFVAKSALNGLGVGDDLSEEVVGTTSHALCINLDQPIYVLSPENYHPSLRKPKVTFSIPIHDQNDKPMAALTIPYFEEIQHTDEGKCRFKSIIALLFMTVKNIEQVYLSQVCNRQIIVEKIPFNSAMSLIDESMISVNSTGVITYANSNAKNLFGTKSNIVGKPYSDLLGEIPELEKLYRKKVNKYTTTTCLSNNQKFLIKVRPFSSALDGNSVLIRISELVAAKNQRLKDTSAINSVDKILGDSAEILKAKRIAKKVANSTKSVLLIGESGTGKELFAQAIHEESRPEGPFIAVNCAALPKSLLESELFGYEGGSFTGADKKGHIGKIELAQSGTLFLDEIGDMPLELQAVLLRVLEDKRVMRIGGTQYRKVDFRVVAATNRNLLEMISNGKFREDLYYRISTFEISIPPLRQRNSDILKLAQLFIEEECKKMEAAVPKLDEDVRKEIMDYEWPGNVRELKNAVDYALAMSMNGRITLEDLPQKITRKMNCSNKNKVDIKTMEELEKEAIEKAMSYTNNNVKNAAELLQMSRTTLYRKIKEYDICDINLD